MIDASRPRTSRIRLELHLKRGWECVSGQRKQKKVFQTPNASVYDLVQDIQLTNWWFGQTAEVTAAETESGVLFVALLLSSKTLEDLRRPGEGQLNRGASFEYDILLFCLCFEYFVVKVNKGDNTMGLSFINLHIITIVCKLVH